MDSKKRLLLITPDFIPNRGGIARYLDELVKYYSNRINVITSVKQTGVNKQENIKVEKLLYGFLWPRWLKTVVILLREKLNYDTVIISHALPFGTAALLAKIITKKPYVLFTHGMDVRLAKRSAWKKFIFKRVLHGAELIVSNSNALLLELSELGVRYVLVVYPCVSNTDVEIAPTDKQKTHILTVSRLVERKGHLNVLNALSILRRANKIDDLIYDIVGTGPFEKSIRSLVDGLGLTSHVVFHGDVDDLQLNDLYRKSDVFVMPVKNDPIDKEGFGLVYIEAAKFSTPSIATDMEGVDEAVLNNETGILVTDGDIEMLAKAIFTLINDDEYRMKLAGNAHKRAVSEFTCENQFAKLDEYL